MASSSSAASAPSGVLIPRPKGGVPKNHAWDGVCGAYIHTETGAVHVPKTRSANSAAQQKERKRDRKDRTQASGAQHRKDARTQAKKADANRRRQAVSQHRRAAHEKARPRLGESSCAIHQRMEQGLLGERFVFAEQRVRVTEGEHIGQCGTVLERAQLCIVEGRSVTSPELDASGRVPIVEPVHHHQVKLDCIMEPVLLSPYAVELWPRIGQSVGLLPGSPNDVCSVVDYFSDGCFLLSRRVFAFSAHVEAMEGGKAGVGSWARLLPPHSDASEVWRDSDEAGPADPTPEAAQLLLHGAPQRPLTHAAVGGMLTREPAADETAAAAARLRHKSDTASKPLAQIPTLEAELEQAAAQLTAAKADLERAQAAAKAADEWAAERRRTDPGCGPLEGADWARYIEPQNAAFRAKWPVTVATWAARVGVPKELRIYKHQIDLAFAVTDYKVQGKTLDYFIVSLGKRGAGVHPKLKLVDLHVLVSRVRLGARLFVIGLDPADADHLRQLRPSEALGVWEHGYDPTTAMWDPARAVAYAAARVAARAGAKATKQRKRKQSAANAGVA